MKTYYVSVPVEEAQGQQTFKVQAESEQEAIQKVESGEDSEIQPDLCEVEVGGLDWEHAEATEADKGTDSR